MAQSLSITTQSGETPDFDRLSGEITREFRTRIDAHEIVAVVTLMSRLRELFAAITPETIKADITKVLDHKNGNLLQIALQAISSTTLSSEVRERITYEVTTIITQMAASVRLVADLSEIAALQPPAPTPAPAAPRHGRPSKAPASRPHLTPEEKLQLIADYRSAVEITMNRYFELHPDEKSKIQSTKATKHLPELLKTLLKLAPFFYKACQDATAHDRPISMAEATTAPVSFDDLYQKYLDVDVHRLALAQAIHQYFEGHISLGSIKATLAYCTGDLLRYTQEAWANNEDGIQDFELEAGKPLRDLLT